MATRKTRGSSPLPPGDGPKVGVKPLAALNLDTANPWDHDDANKKAILGSLRQWGPGRSIVLDGKDNVVAGNCTAEQAAEAGFTEVVWVEPEAHQIVAVRRPDWSPTEARGYSIADNKSASKASPNVQALGEHFKALPEDLWQATGFEKWEIEPLLAAEWSKPKEGTPVEDPEAEWQGMPEYGHENKGPFQTIYIHFRNARDREVFSRLIGQKLTDATKYAWYPAKPPEPFGDVVNESEISDLRNLEGQMGVEADGESA